MRAARAVSLIGARARLATPLYLGRSVGVNSGLMPRLRHNVPNSYPKHLLPLSDRTHITADGVPSAQTYARNGSNALATSDFFARKYIRLNRVWASRTIRLYRFSPIFGRPSSHRNQQTPSQASYLLGCPSTWQSAPVASLSLSIPALVKLPAEADSLLLRRFLGQCLVGVAISAVKTVDVSRGGRIFLLPKSNNGASSVYHSTCRLKAEIPYWRQSFPIKGNCTASPPFSLRVTPLSSTADGWPCCVKEVIGSRL